MRFGSAEYLHLLWLVPLLAGFFFWVSHRRRVRLENFAGRELLGRLVRSAGGERTVIRHILFLLALTFLILSAARPMWGTRETEVARRGVDVIIAMDTSLSMDAEDVKPSRLRKAKLQMTGLVDRLRGDRVGLVAFAGTAFVQCPLTLDHSAAKMFLDIMDSGLIPRPGTALSQAISTSVEAFRSRERKYKVLVLLTDGEDHEGDPLAAARAAAEDGVVIHTVGIGSPAGEPIPIRNEQGRVSGYKKDRGGEVVTSRLDEETLRAIAQATGGLYLRATAGEVELDTLAAEISGMEKRELQSRMHAGLEERFQYPLALALLFLIAWLAIPDLGHRRRSRKEISR
jgi:Ca-activated chloride channel family protein